MKRLLNLTLAWALLAALPLPAADLAPDVLARNTTDDVLAIVRQDKDIQSGDMKKIMELVDAKILPHFDFTRMTRLAVGKSWRQASPAQQESLVREFRTLLVRTYSTAFVNYRNQKIEVKSLKLQPADEDVTVRSQILQPGGEPIPVDYSMAKTSGGWKVYDVIIEGVSLVTTYRGTFNDEIARAGIDGLIKLLVDKNGTPVKAPQKK